MKQKDLAKLSGYSVATISKAFSGSAEISDETKNKIFEIAKKHGVYSKFLSKNNKTKNIVIIVPEIISEYYSNIVTLLINELKKLNALTAIATTNFSTQTEKKLLDYYTTNKRADGIILISNRTLIGKYDIPISTWSGRKSQYCDNVIVDYKKGLFESVKTLKNFGHKTIAFIGENLAISRANIFRSALKFYNLNIDESLITISSSRFEEAGYSAIKKIIKNENKPTAIITAYDYIAIGAIKYLNEHGYAVPDDFSIVGYDDISISSNEKISLSSIRTNIKEASKIISESIIKKIENPKLLRNSDILINTIFIRRNSIKDIKKEQ